MIETQWNPMEIPNSKHYHWDLTVEGGGSLLDKAFDTNMT